MIDWIEIKEDTEPSDERLLVKDEFGNEAYAYPTIYPFKVESTGMGKWTSKVIPCAPYWDGGWLIEVGIDLNKIKGKITHFKKQ